MNAIIAHETPGRTSVDMEDSTFTHEALGILETIGLTPTMVAIDAMEKAAAVRVVQCELNDNYGVVTKIRGAVAAVEVAIAAGREVAAQMGGRPVATVIPQPDQQAWRGIHSPEQYNPLIEQDIVFHPSEQSTETVAHEKETPMTQDNPPALGFLETQGFTAVFAAIDAACKAANVEVVGKEKLGGGYVTVVVQGQVAAVTAAIEAGREQVEGLGKLIAAHVIARPSRSVLGLLPKM